MNPMYLQLYRDQMLLQCSDDLGGCKLRVVSKKPTQFMFDFKDIDGQPMVSSKSIYMELDKRHGSDE